MVFGCDFNTYPVPQVCVWHVAGGGEGGPKLVGHPSGAQAMHSPGVSVVPLQLEAVQNPPAMTCMHVEPVARPVAPDVHVPDPVAEATNSAAVVQYCARTQHQDRSEGE